MFRLCMKECESTNKASLEEEHFVSVEPPVPCVPVVMEIVGAVNLLAAKQQTSRRKSFKKVLPASFLCGFD